MTFRLNNSWVVTLLSLLLQLTYGLNLTKGIPNVSLLRWQSKFGFFPCQSPNVSEGNVEHPPFRHVLNIFIERSHECIDCHVLDLELAKNNRDLTCDLNRPSLYLWHILPHFERATNADKTTSICCGSRGAVNSGSLEWNLGHRRSRIAFRRWSACNPKIFISLIHILSQYLSTA
jgi:hypothetical protein